MADPPVVEFDRDAARRFRPDPDFTKTAVLVEVVDDDAVTVLRTSFGEQRMRGPFYAVGDSDGGGSYGAARAQFESTHRNVGEHRWVKQGAVLAYRAEHRCTVETHLDDHHETSVVADRGDWVVMQSGGEVMVVEPDEFTQRYVPDDEA